MAANGVSGEADWTAYEAAYNDLVDYLVTDCNLNCDQVDIDNEPLPIDTVIPGIGAKPGREVFNDKFKAYYEAENILLTTIQSKVVEKKVEVLKEELISAPEDYIPIYRGIVISLSSMGGEIHAETVFNYDPSVPLDIYDDDGRIDSSKLSSANVREETLKNGDWFVWGGNNETSSSNDTGWSATRLVKGEAYKIDITNSKPAVLIDKNNPSNNAILMQVMADMIAVIPTDNGDGRFFNLFAKKFMSLEATVRSLMAQVLTLQRGGLIKSENYDGSIYEENGNKEIEFTGYNGFAIDTKGNADFAGKTRIYGNTQIHGNTTIYDSLFVSAISNFNKTLNVGGNLNVLGTDSIGQAKFNGNIKANKGIFAEYSYERTTEYIELPDPNIFNAGNSYQFTLQVTYNMTQGNAIAKTLHQTIFGTVSKTATGVTLGYAQIGTSLTNINATADSADKLIQLKHTISGYETGYGCLKDVGVQFCRVGFH